MPPRIGQNRGRIYHPSCKPAGWTGRRFHLGKNKNVFDVELHALYQALKTFEARDQTDGHYTIFSGSAAAIRRTTPDDRGPGQRFAVAAIDVCSRPVQRGNIVTIRWTPTHSRVECEEVAGGWAEAAAECAFDMVDGSFLRETSLTHMARRATEAESRNTSAWITEHAKHSRSYRPPKGKKLREDPWPASTTSSSRDMRQREPTSVTKSTSPLRTGVGGAAGTYRHPKDLAVPPCRLLAHESFLDYIAVGGTDPRPPSRLNRGSPHRSGASHLPS